MNNCYQTVIGGKNVEIELNKFAKQADGSLLLTYGETVLLATVVEKKLEQSKGFFPLVVNYEEKMYATGKIPGSYGRREGRPTDNAILACRLIDRPLRPLFPDGYDNEVQVVVTVLGHDPDHEPEIMAINAASIALGLAAEIPFEGPVAGVHIGLIDGEFIINPTLEQKEQSELELRIAGTNNAINMVEAKANELSEEVVLDAIMFGFEEIKRINTWQTAIFTDQNIEKVPYIKSVDEEFETLYLDLKTAYFAEFQTIVKDIDRHTRHEKMTNFIDEVKQKFEEEQHEVVEKVFDKLYKEEFIRLIAQEKYRLDGRKIAEIRPLASEVELITRVHGTALFTRGETQALAAVTLGTEHD
ncbi:MAG: hypothetical protein ACRCUP_03870, partial [Mycoplasmatales bacterium]